MFKLRYLIAKAVFVLFSFVLVLALGLVLFFIPRRTINNFKY